MECPPSIPICKHCYPQSRIAAQYGQHKNWCKAEACSGVGVILPSRIPIKKLSSINDVYGLYYILHTSFNE